MTWAETHGPKGFLLAASLLNVKSETLPQTARRLVLKAPDPAEVLNRIFANLQSGSFIGPLSSHLEGQLVTLQNWAKDDDPIIRMWAEKAITYAQKSVKHQKLIEEEGMF